MTSVIQFWSPLPIQRISHVAEHKQYTLSNQMLRLETSGSERRTALTTTNLPPPLYQADITCANSVHARPRVRRNAVKPGYTLGDISSIHMSSKPMRSKD